MPDFIRIKREKFDVKAVLGIFDILQQRIKMGLDVIYQLGLIIRC